MKITNDQIEIEADDLAALSAQLQKAIAFRAGDAVPHEYISGRFNAIIEECAYLHKAEHIKQNEQVTVSFAQADVATQNSIKTILGLEVSAEDEAAAPTEASLWERFKSLFS